MHLSLHTVTIWCAILNRLSRTCDFLTWSCTSSKEYWIFLSFLTRMCLSSLLYKKSSLLNLGLPPVMSVLWPLATSLWTSLGKIISIMWEVPIKWFNSYADVDRRFAVLQRALMQKQFAVRRKVLGDCRLRAAWCAGSWIWRGIE